MAIGQLIAFFIILTSVRYTKAGDPCPPNFWHISSFCLYTVTSPVLNTWKESYEACQAQYGSNIIMIKHDFFWQAILSAGASQLNIAPGGIWMGLNYTADTKTYHWLDGADLDLKSDWTLWAPGQPIQTDKDKCILLEKTYVIKKRFGWSLVDCDDADTTGVALCIIDEGDYTKPPQISNGQNSVRIDWNLFTNTFLILLTMKYIFG